MAWPFPRGCGRGRGRDHGRDHVRGRGGHGRGHGGLLRLMGDGRGLGWREY